MNIFFLGLKSFFFSRFSLVTTYSTRNSKREGGGVFWWRFKLEKEKRGRTRKKFMRMGMNEEAFKSAISQNYDFKVKVSKRKAIVIRSIHAA